MSVPAASVQAESGPGGCADAPVPSNEPTDVSAVTKSRWGFLVALIGILAVGGVAALTRLPLLSRNDFLVCAVAGGIGLLCWLAGWFRAANAAEVTWSPDSKAGAPADQHPLSFLTSLKDWGLILMLATGLVSGFACWNHRAQWTVRARPIVATTGPASAAVESTDKGPEVTWPALQLQGVVVNGAKSSAVINGHFLYLGDSLGNVVLVAVSAKQVEVSLQGETKVLALRR
jgi:hypothetical protein